MQAIYTEWSALPYQDFLVTKFSAVGYTTLVAVGLCLNAFYNSSAVIDIIFTY